MARYLLPCPDCHETFPVATRHAGQTIECANCQSAVEIPKLGELRQLPEESEQRTSQSGPPQVRQSRSRLKSWLFSGGLMIAVLSAVAGIALLNYANGLYSPISEYTDLIEKTSNEEIDTMAAAQMWDWFSGSASLSNYLKQEKISHLPPIDYHYGWKVSIREHQELLMDALLTVGVVIRQTAHPGETIPGVLLPNTGRRSERRNFLFQFRAVTCFSKCC